MTGRHRSLSTVTLCVVLASATSGCDEKPSSSSAPKPSAAAAAKPSPCSQEPKLADPANAEYLPTEVGSFCLDPSGSDRAYGTEAKEDIDGLCRVIDGDCELYKQHDVERVIEIRYVDGGGSPATIDLYLSRFASRDKAYAMFTKRVVGDTDPGHPDAARPLEAGGAAALGIGNAYLWRGSFLAEMTLSDGTASTDALRERADQLLPKLCTELGKKLPGKVEPPPAVAALPEAKRLPLGVRFVTEQVLGIDDTGPGAVGYYRADDLRWRLLSIRGADEERAEDVLATMKKSPGAREDEALGEDAILLMQRTGPGSPQAEWLIARKGSSLYGIGDEFLVLRDGMTPEEHRKRTLPTETKRKRLEAWLAETAAKPKE